MPVFIVEHTHFTPIGTAQYMGRMGGHNKLNMREQMSQNAFNSDLPAWMKVRVNFINQHAALGVSNAGLFTFIVGLNPLNK
jgi:hypothetical protein